MVICELASEERQQARCGSAEGLDEAISNGGEGFVGEFIESGDAKFEVFLLGVFDFVVADAVEALDKHHHGGNAGAGDFGGVVKRAGGKAMGFAAGFGYGIGTHLDEFGIEKDGFDLPKAFPGNANIALLREAFAGSFCILEHFGESRRVEVALVKGDAAFRDNTGDDAGFGSTGADGANTAVAALGDAIDFRAHFCGGKESVFATIHRSTAGMGSLAMKGDSVAFDAESAEDCAQGQV